jgi:hypothetical protein
MHTISATCILHPASASSMLRRGGPAQRVIIAAECLVNWHMVGASESFAVGGRVPLAAEHDQERLRHQLMRDRK